VYRATLLEVRITEIRDNFHSLALTSTVSVSIHYADIRRLIDLYNTFRVLADIATLEWKHLSGNEFSYVFHSKDNRQWRQKILIGSDSLFRFDVPDWWKESELSTHNMFIIELIKLTIKYGISKLEVTYY